ncbi:MAG: Fic family protein [Candidatus Omnitrophica bacterium]|nr:Fic family protein [Candidatus Omnitrophota bacterium]
MEKKKIIAKYSLAEWKKVEKDRCHKANQLELLDKKGEQFWFVLSPNILDLISGIERSRGFLTSLKLPKKFLSKLESDVEKKEAYYSSRIEGAVTSLEEALLYLNKPSKKDYGDESLQMIINNRDVLKYIRSQSGQPFDHKMIYRLHKTLVLNTHKERPITVGKYRKGPICVVNGQGKVVYEGPPASKVMQMMDAYIKWVNGFPEIHPLIKAALVHLHFVHIHPFDDGNGRSARALSNLYLMNQDYQFINFLSPSDYFDHHRAAYYRSIQNTRDHGNDATFFIIYYLKALTDQLNDVQTEIEKETKVKDIRGLLSHKTQAKLDKKQIKAIKWMLEHSEKMTTKKYCKLGQCSDETARKDFNQLMESGIIQKIGKGRATGYILRR